MLSNVPNWWLYRFSRKHKLQSARAFTVVCSLLLAASAPTDFFCSAALAQQADPPAPVEGTAKAVAGSAAPVVVQPGAPGKPSRRLPASATAKLPPRSQTDVEFMQGMIMHHAQAVEMTALISS
ncbi:MAG: hypothetical protein WA738_16090, partial [Candidatus Angelobacter sp.]